MRPIHEIIGALKQELQAELAAAPVTVTLHCVVVEKQGRTTFGVVTSADPPGLTTHAIVFQLNGAMPAASTLPASQAAGLGHMAAVSGPPASDLLTSLTAIFGEPGFDNAARASVFREMLEELDSAQLEALLSDLRADTSEVPQQKHADSSIAMARTRLMRLLKLGPAGRLGGLEALLRIFDQYRLPAVVEAIKAHWKTQGHWIDTTPPPSVKISNPPDPHSS
jgi:hypothetical protein